MTTVRMVDTHAHVMDRAFDSDRPAVLARADVAGVERMVLVGYDLVTSRAAVDLARELPGCVASVGIHPNAAGEHSVADFEALALLARAPEVAAIGETGLDYYRRATPRERQLEALEWHVRLSHELDLPLIVHNREADADVSRALATPAAREARGCVPGVLHCFSSLDKAYLELMLEAGYYVSFAGTLTFNSAGELRKMAARVPIDRLLVETDCPYLAPAPHRGRRNEPAFVRDTAACLAEVRGMPFETLAERLWANSTRVFGAFERVLQEVG